MSGSETSISNFYQRAQQVGLITALESSLLEIDLQFSVRNPRKVTGISAEQGKGEQAGWVFLNIKTDNNHSTRYRLKIDNNGKFIGFNDFESALTADQIALLQDMIDAA